jgi:hypothetical protein
VPIINIKYYKPTNPLGRPFIPVEFSVAAYRFGHSITRPRYTVQEYLTSTGAKVKVSSVPLFDELTEANKNNILNGHRSLLLLPRLKLQWSKFFNKAGVITARPVRQFDASLSDALFVLPSTALPDDNPMGLLSQRNLRRGRRMGLPSGQQVARLMGVTPLSNAELSKNHRIYVKAPIDEVTNLVEIVTPPGEFDEPNPKLEKVFESTEWGGEAPLWFYILKEAEIAGDVGTGAGKGRWLGPVGGRIVAEVLVGLLQKDLNSYLYLQPGWKPAPPIAPKLGQFTMADLLTYAQGWN